MVSNLTASSATINWTTDEDADSQVDYGLTAAYGMSTEVIVPLSKPHLVVVSGLESGKEYHFRIKSKDAAANLATSGDFTFTTIASAAQPKINSISPSSGSSGTVVVIRGSGFGSSQGSSTINFNGKAITVSGWSDVSITLAIPDKTHNGDIVVIVSGVSSNAVWFKTGTLNAPGGIKVAKK
jgi:hypothetical protein